MMTSEFRGIRRLLRVQAVALATAGVLLVVRPAAIPAFIGIDLAPAAYLLVYLLAAAGFAFAVLSALGAGLASPAGIRAVALGSIVLHGCSAILEFPVALGLHSVVLWCNIGLRLVLVALFAWLLPRDSAESMT